MDDFVVFYCLCGRYFIKGKWLYIDQMELEEAKRLEDGYSQGKLTERNHRCNYCRG